jgi:hypothetical protein
MDSAPRDGTLLMLRVPGLNALRRHSRADWPDVTLGYFSERMVLPGWYCVEREDNEYASVMELKIEPHGWMPVPQ